MLFFVDFLTYNVTRFRISNCRYKKLKIPLSRCLTVIWFKVVFQLLLPLILFFTPAMIVANSQNSQQMSDKIESSSRQSSFFIKNANNTEKTVTTEDKILQKVMTTGSLLSNTDNPTHAAINMARSVVVTEANAGVQQWLNQFGTARVQLNIDNNFRIRRQRSRFHDPPIMTTQNRYYLPS